MSELYKGKRFGFWTVLDPEVIVQGGNRKYLSAECACQCGKIAVVRAYDLTKGRSTGCRSCKTASHSTIESVCQEIWLQYIRSATTREYIFELTLEDFSKLILSDCFYCGVQPSNKAKRSLPFYTSGVDRKDNTIGYTKENSVPCCATCNRGKHAMSYDEWETYLDKLVEHRR